METGGQTNRVSWWGLVQTKGRRYRLLLARYWWVVLLAASAGLFAASFQFAGKPPMYQSVARMMVSGRFMLPEGSIYSEELANFFGTQKELMQSALVRERAANRVRTTYPDLPAGMVSLAVSVLPQTSIFILQATAGNPDYARRFLDACMDEYIVVKREMRSAKTQTTQTAITEELGRLDKEIRQGEDELLKFQKENNIGFLEKEGNSAGLYLSGLNRQLADLQTEYRLLEKLDLDQHVERVRTGGESGEGAAGAGGAGDGARSGFGPSPLGVEGEYLRAKQQIDVLRAQVEEYGRDLRPQHPIMSGLNDEIARQEALVEVFRKAGIEQLKTRRESIRLQIENVEASIHEWEVKAHDLSERLAEYQRLRSKVDRARAVYDRMLANWHNVDVNQNMDNDIVSVLERAGAAMEIRPGLAKAAVGGALLGLLAGLGFIVLKDQTDDRLASVAEFEVSFRERTLATIPRLAGKGDVVPLRADDDRHAFAEAFRSLRSSLFFMQTEGDPPKGFLVTSAVPNEGKTTIATNLAITMAFSGARVLLVDADLRRGTLHRTFGIESGEGLTDVLERGVPWRDVVRPTAVAALSLLPRGAVAKQPGELLLGRATDGLLRELYREFDYLVFDTCPVMAADDTTSLAPKVDATLLVFRFGLSSVRASRKALTLLQERQANVLGAICNDLGELVQEYYYYRYPQYYAARKPEHEAG